MRAQIDWAHRARDFEEIVNDGKRLGKRYDCLLPVSGGKDSTWQVVKCLEYGLNVLAVTWKTPARTEIGARNLANLVSLGVDHIDYQVNPRTEKKFMYQTLARYGSTAIPMHLALFNIPPQIAVKFGIPMVIWGENSGFEYGGDDDARRFRLDAQWLKKYGVTHGTTARDWVSPELSEKELAPYFGPSDEELEKSGTTAIFLGYFFPWDPMMTFSVAQANGFQSRREGPKTGYYNYADIDDDFISIHHYLKWYKFGFTRTFDNLSLEIRYGRITRDQAIKILQARGDETPHDDIDKFCKYVGITPEHFFELIQKFRNQEIWTRRRGKWMIEGFLIPDWLWT